MTKKERARRIAEGKRKAAAKRSIENAAKAGIQVPVLETRSPFQVPAEPYCIRRTVEELFSDGRTTTDIVTYPNRVRS